MAGKGNVLKNPVPIERDHVVANLEGGGGVVAI